MIKKKISIICPFYNELDAIPLFFNRLIEVVSSIKDIHFEIIFVNNSSTDGSLEKLKELILKKQNNEQITFKIISFSRNFGYQKSLLAGYSHSTGDASIVIDTDLEDPPELILEFIAQWNKGYEVIYGKRVDRQENWLIKKMRDNFYRILSLTADFKINDQMAEFCLISRRVRENILKINPTFTFFRSEIAFLGLKTFGIDYKREKRVAGQTKYNILTMFEFAITGFLTSSTFFLRLFGYSLPFIVGLNLLIIVFFKITNFLIILDAIYIIFNLSILSLYVARLYQISTKRPPYIIDYENSIL